LAWSTELDLSRVACKASYSNGGNGCVEVGVWRTSSYSGNGSDCVEVGARAARSRSQASGSSVEAAAVAGGEALASGGTADAGPVVLVRDSKDRDGGVLALDESAWRAFIAGIKDGEFNPA
jgi:Domain of unknown function (DUF397)